jgi:hypothetical protein
MEHLTAPSWSGFSYSDPKKADNPFNFGDLDGADIILAQAGGGVQPPTVITPIGPFFIPTGYQFARLSVIGNLWVYDSQGMPFFKNGMDMLTNVDVGGPQSALGMGASGQAGSLVKIT